MRKKKNKMKKLVLLLILFTTILHAQESDPEQKKALEASRNITWEANKELKEDKFVSAEAKLRRAISRSDENAVAPYNLGNALYNTENYKEAFGRFKKAGETAPDKSSKHQAFHNMGNVFMKNKEYEKAVEAYKEALRNEPTDEETRYNLALAKEMLKKEQNEQQNNEDENKEDQQDKKDQNKDQQNEGDKEDQNKDQQKDQGEQGDQGDREKEENKEGEGDEKQEQQKQPQSEEEGETQQTPRPNQLSPQQIQNLLEAMQNEERKVQEKLDAQKVKGAPTKSKKDW
jgi:tetratricopeptide (TPR) repeat protein